VDRGGDADRRNAPPDDTYEELRKNFSEAEGVNLTVLIGTINAWNRLAIAFRAVPPAKAKAATAA
jgi:alkylhydroperoxidase family enzyme